MGQKRIEELMDLFELRTDSFTIFGTAAGVAVEVEADTTDWVYFVLHGHGLLESKFGKRDLHQGTVVVLPRNLPHVIAGGGPVEARHQTHLCSPERESLGRIKFGAGQPDLIIGCAQIHATLGGVIDVFQHMWEPMVEDAEADGLGSLLHLIELELSASRIGSRAVIASLFKHLLITLFRGQLARETFRSWLWPAMMNPQLGRAALAIMSRPQESHSVESLAAVAGLSRSRFTELFTESFERTPMEFLQVVRLRAAKRLLTSSALPIKAVAAAVGYASRSHFSRTFQAEFGDAPSAFRDREGAIAIL